VREDQWGDLECLHKDCQAAINDGGLFTDTGVDERGENERQSENDCEMKTATRVKGSENRQDNVTQLTVKHTSYTIATTSYLIV